MDTRGFSFCVIDDGLLNLKKHVSNKTFLLKYFVKVVLINLENRIYGILIVIKASVSPMNRALKIFEIYMSKFLYCVACPYGAT